MRFFVNYFGCRANQAEIQDWIIDLENAGYELTSSLEDADFGILNTCSVTEKADKDVVKYLNRVYKKSNIKWIVAGCSVSKETGSLKDRYHDYIFLDNSEKADMVERVRQIFPVDSNIIYHSAFRSRAFLKIQDGCNFRCSYCIVPLLRGKSVSYKPEEIYKKAAYYAALGYREIVLTGINLSSYGFDLFPRESLLDIVRIIDEIEGIDLVRLSSLDPRYLSYDFVKELSNISKVAPSFHFSFQSGSNSVLKRMKRGSKAEDYLKILNEFRGFFPDANYGADFIFGFPEESEREYQETVDFINNSGLTYMHLFPYSPREGTKAASMPLVADNIVQRRMKEVQEINRTVKVRYRESFINRAVSGILIEENSNYSMVVTDNFLSVKVPPVEGFKKRSVKVKIEKVINDNLCEGAIIP